MGAPLTIEQIVLNHNIGVNLSDAESLDGHTIDEFSMVGHEHSANDVTSGIMDPARLPMATDSAKGIVGLSSSTDSESQVMAATPYAVKAVKNIANSKADASHKHSPADINTGTFPAIVAAFSNTNYTTRQIRNVYLSTSSPTASSGSNGDLWFKYEV